jgi:hypothetical protein
LIRINLLTEARATMIKRFHALYVGQIELDNIGLGGTPANDRRYSNDRLAEVFWSAELLVAELAQPLERPPLLAMKYKARIRSIAPGGTSQAPMLGSLP